jgi:hypothetical protein
MDICEARALPSFYRFDSNSFIFLKPDNLTQSAGVKTRGKRQLRFEIARVKSQS